MTCHSCRYSDSEVAGFMKTMVSWMQQQQWLLAYSWHDSQVGSSALLGPNGQLTSLGAVYASL